MNTADTMVYTAEKTKSDLQDKMSDDQKNKLDNGIKELKETIATKNHDALKSKTDELSKILQDIGMAVYQQEAAQQKTSQNPEQQEPVKESKDQGPDNVVDADYKVVDENKKNEDSKS